MNLALSNSFLDLLLGLSPRDWNSYLLEQVRLSQVETRQRLDEEDRLRRRDLPPSRPLGDFVGAYDGGPFGLLHVARDDDGLTLAWHAHTGRLHHFERDRFVFASDALGWPKVQFTCAPHGVSALTMEQPVQVTFAKTRPE
jgi:hypothetical protein